MTFIVIVMSMAYELIATGRNCSQDIANIFVTQEIRVRANSSALFPAFVSNSGSVILIRMLMVLFVILSMAVGISTAYSKKKFQRRYQVMVLKTNSETPEHSRIASQKELNSDTNQWELMLKQDKRNRNLLPTSTTKIYPIETPPQTNSLNLAQLLGSIPEQLSVSNSNIIYTNKAPSSLEDIKCICVFQAKIFFQTYRVVQKKVYDVI